MKKLAIVCIVLVCTGCSSYPKYYPYSFDQEAAKKVNRVALAPLNMYSPLPSPVGNKQTVIYNAIKTYLTDHGMSCLSGETVRTAWEEEKRKVGGVYDPVDGSTVKEKFNACLKNTVARVSETESVQAVIFPEIVPRNAFIYATTVYWDGAEHGMENVDRTSEFYSGTTSALSLKILIIDKDGRLILRNIAGIEHPFRKRRGPSVTEWEAKKETFTDRTNIDRALAVGFHPFLFYPGYPANPPFSEEKREIPQPAKSKASAGG